MMEGKALQPGEHIIYPIWWEDTATTRLQTRFKEITAEIERVVKGVPRENLLEEVCKHVYQSGHRSYFRRLSITPQAHHQ